MFDVELKYPHQSKAIAQGAGLNYNYVRSYTLNASKTCDVYSDSCSEVTPYNFNTNLLIKV